MTDNENNFDGHPKHKFIRLLEKCERLGMTPCHIESLQSFKEIQKHINGNKKESAYLSLLVTTCKLTVCVILMLTLIWLLNWPVERTKLASAFLSLRGIPSQYHNDEICVVEIPHDMHTALRPPVSCDFCKNVTHIPRVSGITPEDFEEHFAYSGQPIVIVDATTSWTAMEVYNFKFFQDVHRNVTKLDENQKDVACQFFPYKTKFKSLDDVFDMSLDTAYMKDGSPPWYIGWKNCDFTIGSILRQHYSRPYFLPVLAESSKTDWIFMGSPGYGANLHIDDVGNPSWQAQITGVKRWILEPPPECYYTCTSHMEVVVQPGEIMVLDANMWYHQTIIQGQEIAIAIGSEYD